MNAYVNEIFLGQDGARAIHGFGLGSSFYFNKPLLEPIQDEFARLYEFSLVVPPGAQQSACSRCDGLARLFSSHRPCDQHGVDEGQRTKIARA